MAGELAAHEVVSKEVRTMRRGDLFLISALSLAIPVVAQAAIAPRDWDRILKEAARKTDPALVGQILEMGQVPPEILPSKPAGAFCPSPYL